MPKRIRLKHQQLASELAKSRVSQNRWAERLGMGRGHLSLLVNGKRPFPSRDTRKKLLEGLGVPFSTLFEIEDVPLPGGQRPRHLAWLPRSRTSRHASQEGRAMSSVLQDLRHAARSLLQRPLLSAVIVLVLALGIGANTAMFSWINGLLLDPLKVSDPDRWMTLGVRGSSGFIGSFSYPNFQDHRELNEAFDDLMALRPAPVSIRLGQDNQRASAELVSGNFFAMLQASAMMGRTFGDAEDLVPGRDAVAVVSHGFWQRELGGDPAAVGREFTLNAHPFTVIGVMPPNFGLARVESDIDLWVPLAMQEVARPGSGTLECRGCGFLIVHGRMRPNSTRDEVTAAINAVNDGLAEQYPEFLGETTIAVQPTTEAYMGFGGTHAAVSSMSWILLGLVGAVLLICCANVAGLMLARAADREREIGIRQALGASRTRLLRQMLGESLLLAAVAGVVGIALATLINRLLTSFKPPLPFPIRLDVSVDAVVLAYTAAAALTTGLVFGLLPAIRASRVQVLDSLRGGGDFRNTSGSRMRSLLVTAQIAISVVLLVSAGLFLRSLGNASSIDAGFDADGVLLATLDPGLQGYTEDEVQAFYRQIMERLAGLPGVQSVSAAEMLPLTIGNSQQWGTGIEGYEPAPDERMNLDYNYVTPGYFETLGIPVVSGRDFAWDDDLAGTGAVIVNETMARRFWPDADPLGQRLRSGGMWRDVVGVVRDIKYASLGEEAMAYMYFPLLQSNQSSMTLHVRTDADPATAANAIRAQVQELDRSLPIFDVRTMRDQVGGALLPSRLLAWILGIFGGFALLLAAVGLYGVISYAVGQRTREIGIRMALGADHGTILRLVLRQALVMGGLGLTLGLLGGVAVGRVAGGMLYGVGSADPAALGAGLGVIALVSLLATAIPARRAARIDPVDALRSE